MKTLQVKAFEFHIISFTFGVTGWPPLPGEHLKERCVIYNVYIREIVWRSLRSLQTHCGLPALVQLSTNVPCIGISLRERCTTHRAQGRHRYLWVRLIEFGTMLFQCWTSVYDAGPALKQHCVNALCLLRGGVSSPPPLYSTYFIQTAYTRERSKRGQISHVTGCVHTYTDI